MGFGSTRAEARQMVSHRAIMVNNKIVNIPSYIVAPGDIVSVRERSRQQIRIQSALTLAQSRTGCEWLDINAADLSGTYKRVPDRSELPPDINENLIVELYSK